MSAWRRRLQVLHDLGPGRYPARKFDMLDQSLESAKTTLSQLVSQGYVHIHRTAKNYNQGCTYSVSQLGLDILEGRVEVRHKFVPPGGLHRTKCIPTATWLSSLPRRNEITIQP